MLTAGDIIAAARTRVVRQLSYFADVTMSLRPFPLEGLGTFGVDDKSRMAFDPVVALAWGVIYCATAILHGALHILLDHHGRRGWREARRWNFAADMEINRILREAGFEFPPNFKPVTAEAYGLPPGLTAEQYYDLLPEDVGKDTDPSQQSFPGCGQDDGEGAGAPQGWEKDADEKSDGIVGQTDGEKRAMRRAAAQRIREEASKSRNGKGGKGGKGIGSVPAGLQVWATLELTPPTIRWQNILASMVRSAVSSRSGADDYTRTRVSRRGAALQVGGRGAILPSLRSPQPEVAVVVDLSGSMHGRPAMVALSESWAVVKALGLPVKGYAVDTVVHAVAVIQKIGDLEKLNCGGGGTDMREGLRVADKDRPDVIVLLTDGGTPWPEPNAMPRAKLVVGVIGDSKVPAHLGRVVRIPVVEEEAA